MPPARRRSTSSAPRRRVPEQSGPPTDGDLARAGAVLGPQVARVGQEAEGALAHRVLPAPLLDLPGRRGGEALDDDGADGPGQELEVAAAALAPEAGLHGTGVPPRHREPDQVAEAGLDVGAFRVGKRPHVRRRIHDRHVGPPHHDAQLHEVQVARAECPLGPGPLVVQGAEHGEVAVAAEDLDGDGPPVEGVLARARPGAQRGEGGRVVRHRAIVAPPPSLVPPPPRCSRAGSVRCGSSRCGSPRRCAETGASRDRASQGPTRPPP